jgi:hypothetical protein
MEIVRGPRDTIVFSNPSACILQGVSWTVIGAVIALFGLVVFFTIDGFNLTTDLLIFTIGFCFLGVLGISIGLSLIFFRRDIKLILNDEKLIIYFYRKREVYYKDIDTIIDHAIRLWIIIVTRSGEQIEVYKWFLKGWEESFKMELRERIERKRRC